MLYHPSADAVRAAIEQDKWRVLVALARLANKTIEEQDKKVDK